MGFQISSSQASPVSGSVTLSATGVTEPGGTNGGEGFYHAGYFHDNYWHNRYYSRPDGLIGVQFKLDGYAIEAPVKASPFDVVWSAGLERDSAHVVTAEAAYTSGYIEESNPLFLDVSNPADFGRSLYIDSVNGNDANDGLSEATAWKSLSKIETEALAGDTFNLKGATFGGEFVRVRLAATAAAPCRVRTLPGSPQAVITGGAFGAIFAVEGCDHWAFEDIKLLNEAEAFVIRVFGSGAKHVRLRDLLIEDMTTNGIHLSGDNSGNRPEDVTIEECEINRSGNFGSNAGSAILIDRALRTRVLGNRILNGGHDGVGMGGSSGATGETGETIIAHNVIDNPWATGIAASNFVGGNRVERSLIEYNVIKNSGKDRATQTNPGIQIQASYSVIRRNAIYDQDGDGLELAAYEFGGVAQEAVGNLIYNNVWYNGAYTGIFNHEEDGLDTKYNLIANSIVFKNVGFFKFGGLNETLLWNHDKDTVPSTPPEGKFNGNEYRNNIFLRGPLTAGEKIVIKIPPNPPGDPNDRYTLAELHTAYSDLTSDNIEDDPLFLGEDANGDIPDRSFRLQSGSPAKNAGMLIPRFWAGIRIPRERNLGSAPDIGAIEHEVAVAGSSRPAITPVAMIESQRRPIPTQLAFRHSRRH